MDVSCHAASATARVLTDHFLTWHRGGGSEGCGLLAAAGGINADGGTGMTEGTQHSSICITVLTGRMKPTWSEYDSGTLIFTTAYTQVQL